MEFRILTALVIANLFVSLIQVAVAPAANTPVETKKLDLLLNKNNAKKVSEVFFLAARNKKDKARAKIKKYGPLPAELKTILDNIANDPWKVQGEVIKPMMKETDKKFASKSLAYRMVVKPLWHLVKSVTFAAGVLLGSAVMSAGDILQVVASATRESVVAGNDGKPLDEKTERKLNEIDEAAKAVHGFGQEVTNRSQQQLDKVQRRMKETPGNADASAAQQGVKPPSVRRQDTPPPPSPSHRQHSLSDDDNDPHRQEQESASEDPHRQEQESASSHQKDGSTSE